MLFKYRQDYEKTVMGFLSYLPDFKNLNNLRQEMKLYNNPDNHFEIYLFSKSQQSDYLGIIGLQHEPKFVVVRYIALAPDIRNQHYEKILMQELQNTFPQENITAVPDYTYLLKYLRSDQTNA
ncbi:MAG: reductase [Lactobacillus sp.]|jgi:riboflavin biosynthesis RibT protein|nr:reductase [Lactobacillus sp.]MCH3906417.1 reductase [Lactobacillus sp.]MCH3990008.1 reductase [Lactobacillus sp.]MCH4069278.1 reductase [Lactobacillus sp.]MCI1303580.1 reductase [Lactobacillus sp.]